VETLTASFDRAVVDKVLGEHGPARMITAANVFGPIAEPYAVVDAIVALLAPDGVFANESRYLLSPVGTLQYDTIYHEHLRYHHLGAGARLLATHDPDIFHVKPIPTHGGSIRIYAARNGARSVEARCLQRARTDPFKRGSVSTASARRRGPRH
jgi:hypothetical protein